MNRELVLPFIALFLLVEFVMFLLIYMWLRRRRLKPLNKTWASIDRNLDLAMAIISVAAFNVGLRVAIMVWRVVT